MEKNGAVSAKIIKLLLNRSCFSLQEWPTPRSWTRWNTATGCRVLRAVLQPSTTLCWSAGTRTQWRDPRSKPCNGSLKTFSHCQILSTKKHQHTDNRSHWQIQISKLPQFKSDLHHPKCCWFEGTFSVQILLFTKLFKCRKLYWKLCLNQWSKISLCKSHLQVVISLNCNIRIWISTPFYYVVKLFI